MDKKKKTKVDLVLEILADGKWHWGEELGDRLKSNHNDPIYKARHRRNCHIEKVRIGLKNQYRWIL